jgi:hypothetical protein
VTVRKDEIKHFPLETYYDSALQGAAIGFSSIYLPQNEARKSDYVCVLEDKVTFLQQLNQN